MSVHDLSPDQRLELRYVRPLHLFDITLPPADGTGAALTLHFATQSYRYRFGSSEILYEGRILEYSGLGAADEEENSEAKLKVCNGKWGAYEYLSRLDEDYPFVRADVAVYEIPLIDTRETFASDVRSVLSKVRVGRLGDISKQSFTLGLFSRLYDLRDSLGLEKITTAVYPEADPDRVGAYLNILYGSLEKVPTHCVETGGVDLLVESIGASRTSFTTAGISPVAFAPSGTLRIDNEEIPYAAYDPETFTFSGCTRGDLKCEHLVGTSVTQVLDRYVYLVAGHPIQSVDAVFIEDLRMTGGFTLYTGRAGDELAGYEGKAAVVFDKDPTRTHAHSRLGAVSTCKKTPTGCSLPESTTGVWQNGKYVYDGNTDNCAVLTNPGGNNEVSLYLDSTAPGDIVKVEIGAVLHTAGSLTEAHPVQIWYGNTQVGSVPAAASLGTKTYITYDNLNWNDPIKFKFAGSPTDSQLGVYEVWATFHYTSGSQSADSTCKKMPLARQGIPSNAVLLNAVLAYDGDLDHYAVFRNSYGPNAEVRFTLEPGACGEIVKVDVTLVYQSQSGIDSTHPVQVYYGDELLGTLTTLTSDTVTFTSLNNKNWNDPVRLRFGGSGTGGILNIYGVWATFSYFHSETTHADLVQSSKVRRAQVTVDCKGFRDDAAGTYTGTPNALIEYPDHVFGHILRVLLGQPAQDTGASFAVSGAQYRLLDYKFAFILSDVATQAPALLKSLAAQARSSFHDWGGKFELRFLPDSPPEPDCSLTEEDLRDPDVQHDYSSSSQLKNRIRGFYRRDYRGDGSLDPDSWTIDAEALSRGYTDMVEVFEGAGDLVEDLELPAVRSKATALSVINHRLADLKAPRLTSAFTFGWKASRLAPGKWFSYTDPVLGARTYRVTVYKPVREKGTIDLEGKA